MNENNKMIANALSLRTQQRKSLDLLEQIAQKITLKLDTNLEEAIDAITFLFLIICCLMQR